MKTIQEQLTGTNLALHSDLLSVGKCNKCKVVYVWLKKGGKSLKDSQCNCGEALGRTTFTSTLPIRLDSMQR